MQATCAKCGKVAQIEPVGSGFRYSVASNRLNECRSITEHMPARGCALGEIDCDNLLDAISLEYGRLLRSQTGGEKRITLPSPS